MPSAVIEIAFVFGLAMEGAALALIACRMASYVAARRNCRRESAMDEL